MTRTYHVIATRYVGYAPDHIDISTLPARDLRGAVVVDGDCGTVDGWHTIAHGAYDTIDSARAAIAALYGETRDVDSDGQPWLVHDDGVVEIHRPGRYAPLGRAGSRDWVDPIIADCITATTTDAYIASWVWGCEDNANTDHGVTLDQPYLIDYITQYRDRLRAEAIDV